MTDPIMIPPRPSALPPNPPAASTGRLSFDTALKIKNGEFGESEYLLGQDLLHILGDLNKRLNAIESLIKHDENLYEQYQQIMLTKKLKGKK